MSLEFDRSDLVMPARKIDMSEVPIIDFAPFLHGGPAEAARVAAAIADACEQIGFFYLVGHGVSPALLDALFDQTAQFYALSLDERRKVEVTPQWYRGWMGPAPVGPSDQGPTRRFEQYRIQEDVSRDDDEGDYGVFYRPNRWPEKAPYLRAVSNTYFGAMSSLGSRLLEAFALGLGLPKDRFKRYFTRPPSQLSLLYYIALSPEDHADIARQSAPSHTDESPFTILAQKTVGGLEIKHRDGRWISAPPIDGAFTINIGDMLMWWSNGRYLSNYHRVRNTSPGERYSIPFFMNPDPDVVIEPLAELVATQGAVRYPPVNVGTHLTRFYSSLEKTKTIGSLPGRERNGGDRQPC